jgi:hypothetical protein
LWISRIEPRKLRSQEQSGKGIHGRDLGFEIGTWDLGLGSWDLGLGTWDLGLGRRPKSKVLRPKT